jgi:hypothetical protein
MSSQFEIDFVSDARYEKLTLEISFRGQRLCQINKDKGNENMEIEFISDIRLLPEEIAMKFSLNEFEEVLRQAKEDLKSCN